MTVMRVLPSEGLDSQVAAFARSVASAAPEHSVAGSSGPDYSHVWRKLSESGWHLIAVPEASGGAGADLRDLQEFVEHWGSRLVPVPLTPSLLVYRWLAPSGSALDGSAATIAVPTPKGSVIPFARWPGVVCFAGFQQGEPQLVRLPDGDIDDFAPSLPLLECAQKSVLTAALMHELRAVVSAEAVGIARAVLSMSVDYATGRTAYGQRIVEFQAVRHILANMHRDVEFAKTASVWSAQEDADDHLAAIECLRLSRGVVENAIQIHGGVGFTWDLGIHFYLRHLIALKRVVGGGARKGGIGGHTGSRREVGSTATDSNEPSRRNVVGSDESAAR